MGTAFPDANVGQANARRTVANRACDNRSDGVERRSRNAMLCTMPTRRSKNDAKKAAEEVGLLGVGLDNDDGHKRLTRGDDFCVVGGSAETHERMQDLVIRMNEKLRRQGKSFRDLSHPEFEELARDSFDE